MPTTKQIKSQLEEAESLKMVASAYTEIAAQKLQKIRAGIERNRKFFSEINEITHIINVAAHQKHIMVPFKKSGTVSLIITSNHHFFGDIEDKLIKFYMMNTPKFPTDRILIGATAIKHFQAINYPHPFKTFILKEDLPTYQELKALTAEISHYSQISVYYSRMQSVVIQAPHVVDLVQKPLEAYILKKGEILSYIFEPELKKMLDFFDNQVVSLLLEQTFLESELARTASRLMSMDKAQINAGDILKTDQMLLSQSKKSEINMALLETSASLMNFRKEGI
ncbi:MAG: FoF1 ATP synthase subunit gamma [Candidatus Daviesbacteria bacterium]|nr:FoF1 ATP synthase subunit gamma [Candidatus Daviesbacteria bacterium]